MSNLMDITGCQKCTSTSYVSLRKRLDSTLKWQKSIVIDYENVEIKYGI